MAQASFRSFTVAVLLLLTHAAAGQDLDNLRLRRFAFRPDSLSLSVDTLSIIPGSVVLRTDRGDVLPDTAFVLDAAWARLRLRPESMAGLSSGDSLQVEYRVYPFLFAAPRYLRDRRMRDSLGTGSPDKVYLTERPSEKNASLFGLEGLTRSGSISRGLTIGNNQDAVLNSSLNLQLSGKIGGNLELLAAISDENIPVQPEGNTQQLQEFDRVFIQLNDDKHKLIAGDYDVRNPEGYFLRYFKKAQGGLYSYTQRFDRHGKSAYTISGGIGASVSRGKFNRMVFNGIESTQGPYRLRGADNESFIVIMSNSERVFIDGILLERGQDRDYVIDYNTAEITFTTRRLINKDLRITVEFQYADRNYARTLTTGYTSFSNDRIQAGINVYSEQDSKNQPLQQTLDEEDKAILAGAGDNPQLAFTQSGDSVAFNVNEILYARRDTTVGAQLYQSVFVYSTSPDSAYFRVAFSNVGSGNGNYIPVDNIANGRVYQWVAPVNGIPQGSYEPKVQLIAPRQRQMASGYVRFNLRPQTKLGIELAASKDDLNRFSKKDKANDDGYAARLTFDHRQALHKQKPEGWTLQAAVQTEVNDAAFRPVEVYRAVEFARDWNTTGLDAFDREWLSNAQVSLLHVTKGELRYGLRSLLRGDAYTGLMQVFGGRYQHKAWFMSSDGSWLNTRQEGGQSSFLRHRDEVRRAFGTWIPGLRYEQERNEIRKGAADSLSVASFHFRIAEVFMTRPDTVRLPVRFSVSRRTDDGLRNSEFIKATVADMAGAGIGWNGNPRQKVNLLVSYRNLKVIDTALTTVRPEESTTGRVDYNLQAAKGFLSVNSFYEGGTGREPRRLYSYVQVAPGTGNYTWNDYNGDGVPQLNEFEVAAFSDQANYIRIFSNTDQYVKVFFNQLNAVVQLNPAVLVRQGKRPVWTRFSLLSNFRYDNRFTGRGGLTDWNPFPGGQPDSVLLTAQANARHSLFFDRSSSVFAADISVQQQKVRQALASGLETRSTEAYSSTIRWNIVQWLALQQKGETGIKSSEAESFASRNFSIRYIESETRINYQPGSTYRVTGSYRYKDKENGMAESVTEKAVIHDIGFEARYNSVRKGLLSARFNRVEIRYNADTNTPLAFEMLEGLKAGINYTWGLSFQRNLGNSLQLGINYEGRRPAGTRIIHTGSAQVRAFF